MTDRPAMSPGDWTHVPLALSERGALTVAGELRARQPPAEERGLGARLWRTIGFSGGEDSREHAFGGGWAQAAAQDCMYRVQDGIAILPIVGPLLNRSYWGCAPWTYQGLGLQFRTALADPDVQAVLLEIDSPGGLVAGLFEFVDEIHAARGRKPVWAVAADTAASAAYAIASAADRVVLPETGDVGSVGVLMIHFDESGMLERFGVAVTPIFAGARKIDGNWWEGLSDEARARFQADVDASYAIFVGRVARNRGLTEDQVRATEALTYKGADALETGFADAVMSPREAFLALRDELSGGERSEPVASRGDDAMKPGTEARRAEDQRAEDQAQEENEEEEAQEEEPENDEEEMQEDEEEENGKAASPKARIKAILRAPEAKGRRQLAEHLAFDTELSVKEAKALLAKAPSGEVSKAEKFRRQMRGAKTPAAGADGGGGSEGKDSRIDRAAALYQRRTGERTAA